MKTLRIILVYCLVIWLAVGNAFAATSIPTTVTAYVSTTSLITVTPSTISFGTSTTPIGADATTYRYKQTIPADIVKIGYIAAGTYEIRVYTDNGVGTGYADARGFIRDDKAADAHRLYLKIWCPNFSANKLISGANGPLFSTTSSQSNYLWGGFDINNNGNFDPDDPEEVTSTTNIPEAIIGQDLNGNGNATDTIPATLTAPVTLSEGPSFSYLREKGTMDEGVATSDQVGTRCVLAWNTMGQTGRPRGEQAGALLNPFPVILGADLNGVANGTYSSSNNGTTPITAGQTPQNGVIFEIWMYL